MAISVAAARPLISTFGSEQRNLTLAFAQARPYAYAGPLHL